VLIAGPFGLTPAGRLPLDVFLCERRDVCLTTPGAPLVTVSTNAAGQFVLVVPIEIVRRRVLLVLQVFVGGVRCRLLLTPPSLPAGAGGGAQEAEITVDPITEAATRLLEDAGLASYGDAGIDAVIDAVQAANADTDFAGLDAAAANDVAEATAAADPAVQAALEENGLACIGDCDGDGTVGVDELVLSVGLAVNEQSIGGCASIDVDRDGAAAVHELIAAVGNALGGCP
jgi:hypothetical protein